MEAYKKLKERFETAGKEHEKRLAPPRLNFFPLEVLKRAGVTPITIVGNRTASLIHNNSHPWN
jgi:hypothetical protein